jgi:hypothetical protein
MADTSGVLARLQAALSVYDPTWDVSVGTATYKILESVAKEIALANNNSVLQTYSYDVNTKNGIELDTFCNLFGVYRQFGKRASGLATFSVNTPSTNIIDIPLGTQIAVPIGTNYTSAIYYATSAPAIIGVGSTSVDVPIIATLPGAYGNVPTGAITTKVSSLVGITSVVNNSAITGGLDPESDASLRARWQSTAFNNNIGTQGKYILTALQDPNVTLANTVSQQTFYSEQLQINSSISGTGNAFTMLLVAYSGMTSVISGTTFSGTTVVASSGFTGSVTGSALASGITAMISGVAPNYQIVASPNSNTNTVNGTGVLINYSAGLPYRIMIGSGTSIPGASVTTSGVTTVSGVSYYSYIQSANPDIGTSGTLSYNGTFGGYVYPQGNELIGSNLNTPSQIVYANNTDYYYPTSPTAPLVVTIANNANQAALFAGNQIQLISEYCPASSRSITLASGNFIDIFINGTSASSATEQIVFNPSFTLSSGNAIASLNTVNYTLASGTVATTNSTIANDIYIPLNQQPVINFPSQLSTSTSGIADSIYLYNVGTSSGTTYPIALNKYPWVTFTGTVVSGATTNGTTFIPVTNANGLSQLYPGLALANSAIASGSGYYITQVTSSGVYVNQNITAPSGTATTAAISGKTLVYPIYDTTDNKNSVLQTTGLAFDVTTPPSGWPALPTLMSWLKYNHNYNSDVVSVETLVQQSRPLGTNTLVHQANYINLVLNLRIVFSSGFTPTSVETNIANNLATYFSSFYYLGSISFSTLAAQILSVPGVSNVKVTSINTVALDGTILTTQSSDFNLASNQLPLLNAINFTVKGNSNF